MFGNTTNLLFLLFSLSLLINTLYYIVLLCRRWIKAVFQSAQSLPPISVVICTKNGGDTLPALLESLLCQDYPQYEIIAVDDGSTDATWNYLQSVEAQYSILRSVQIQGTAAGKKEALYKGISLARHEWIAVTDDDCIPTRNWLSAMGNTIRPAYHFILGYSPYMKKRGLLNALIRYETVITAIQYIGWARLGYPYMGVGRNMLMHKTGIPHIEDIQPELASGDDDLMIGHAGNAQNTGICLQPEAFVYSRPKDTWREWWAQKKRHVTTAVHYRYFHQAVLGAHGASQIALLLGMPLLFTPAGRWVVLLVLTRYTLLLPLYYGALKRLKAGDLLLVLPILDVGISVLYFLLIPFAVWGKGRDW